ncbi:hypothetical protein D9M69_563250 [compost metagenome]
MAEAAADITPVPLAPETISPEERERRARIDAEDSRRLATFVDAVQTVLRDKATSEANATNGARDVAERFAGATGSQSWTT